MFMFPFFSCFLIFLLKRCTVGLYSIQCQSVQEFPTPVYIPSATHFRTACAPHPSKEDGGTLERGAAAYPAPTQDDTVTSDQWSASPPSPSTLCGHPRRYTTIPSTAAPSPAPWEPRTTRHHHTRCCATSSPPSTQPSSWRTDDDQTRGFHSAPSKLPLDEHMTRRDARQKQDLSGRPSSPWRCTPYRHS
jgi:hypothetical protein